MGGDAKSTKMFEFPIGKHMRNNYALLPIVVVCAFGMSLSAFQIIRTLSKNPDVHLNKTKNPRPWEKLNTPDGKAVQFKYFSTKDYSEFNSERPRLD